MRDDMSTVVTENIQSLTSGNTVTVDELYQRRINDYSVIKRLAYESGYNLVAGSFERGGTINSISDALWSESTGTFLTWGGVLPKVVSSGSTITSAGGISSATWTDVTNVHLIGINIIASNMTLIVPTDYETIGAAFTYLRTKTISEFATVTIQVIDGTYSMTETQSLNHPQGSNIKVLGNVTDPTKVILTTSEIPTFDLLKVDSGNTLGLLDGFSIRSPTKATAVNNYTAILADGNSKIYCGANIKVNNWYYGIAARNGSYIYCRYATVSNSGDVGIWSFNGSVVDAQYATSTNASDSTNSWGWGFEAEYGSILDCSYGTGSGCLRGGAGSLSNSIVRAINFNGTSNTGSGIYAISGGVIEAHNAVLTSNTRFGYEQETSGLIYGNNITTTGNTIAAYSNYAYFDNSYVNGARLAANGSLRIDTNSAASIFFNTSGGGQFEIAHVASAVNHPYVTGSTTGSPVVIGATGTDAVIDLALLPKGAGSYVKLGAGYVSNADAAIVGYLPVKDNTGTIRKLAIIA